jgi:hypothetical protein
MTERYIHHLIAVNAQGKQLTQQQSRRVMSTHLTTFILPPSRPCTTPCGVLRLPRFRSGFDLRLHSLSGKGLQLSLSLPHRGKRHDTVTPVAHAAEPHLLVPPALETLLSSAAHGRVHHENPHRHTHRHTHIEIVTQHAIHAPITHRSKRHLHSIHPCPCSYPNRSVGALYSN